MWCVQIGHGRREMAAAIAEQAMRLSYNSPWGFANEPAARLARKLAELAPGDLNTVMFTTGGSTAVDTALRFTHFYNNRRGLPEKKIVISRERSYHGSTYLSASASGKERFASWFDREHRLVHFLPDVSPNLRPEGVSLDEWAERKARDLEDAIRHTGAERVAAFIAEPILASGGVVIPAPGYHERCLEICRRHDVLYISDEVVTAFGRLGHWFASKDVFGIEPDIITCAKGLTSGYLPLGRLPDLRPADGRGHRRGPREHPVLQRLHLFRPPGLLCRGAGEHPHHRGRGAARACPRDRPALQRAPARAARPSHRRRHARHRPGRLRRGPPARHRATASRATWSSATRVDTVCEGLGLIVRPLVNMCVFSPPLIITEDQIDAMFDILDTAIGQVAVDLGRARRLSLSMTRQERSEGQAS